MGYSSQYYQYYLYVMNPSNKQSNNLGSLPTSSNWSGIGPDGSIYTNGSNYLYKIGPDQSAWDPQYYSAGSSLGQPVVAADGTV